MTNPLVRVLGDAGADWTPLGGKGASLARLAAAGLPVPPGFCVTTRAYCDFVSAGVGSAIRRALGNRNTAPEVIAGQISEAFAAAEIPAEIASVIRSAYLEWPVSGPVAVRSSASAEDLADMSFAGQYDTFLNVNGSEEVLAAVKRCWASLWTARAIGYRDRNGVSHADLALAVVVQQLVPAAAAGVMFTANPVTGDRNSTMINAAWGLGEAVVDGTVTPDTYVLTNGRWHREINDKKVMTVPASSATVRVPVPAELRSAEVLDMATTSALAELGRRIERVIGAPADVEWAVHDGRIAILQARPITALPEA